jgi:hypothetical protein
VVRELVGDGDNTANSGADSLVPAEDVITGRDPSPP